MTDNDGGALSSDVWEQEVPQGGADLAGDLPRQAVPVVSVGIATVREVPVLRHTSGSYSLAAGQTIRLVGRAPQRRRLLVSAQTSVILGDTEQQAQGAQGFYLPAGYLPVPLKSAAEVWVNNPGATAAIVSFWAEIDQG